MILSRVYQTFSALMFKEFKFTFRRLSKSPGFAATSLLILALCIGVNLTIFAVIDSVILRPLPFPAPDRLVTIFNSYPKAGVDRAPGSLTNYYERRGNISAFSELSAYRSDTALLGEGTATVRAEVMKVSPEFFTTLGIGPVLGRAFSEDEMSPQADNVVILTDKYWRQQFSSDPGVLGRKLRVDDINKTIVGVLPAKFDFLSSAEKIFLPLSSYPIERTVDRRYYGGAQLVARLRSGASVIDAQSQIDAHNAAHAGEFPHSEAIIAAGFRSFVVPLHADYIRGIRPTLLLLQGGALLLLVIGGFNMVNLLLIRASGRSKEYAVRQSLGASWQHVVKEVLTETISLTFAGGICGLVLSWWGIHLLAAFGSSRLPLGSRIGLDAEAIALSLLGSVLLGFLISLPIAWFNLNNHLAQALKSESRGGSSSRGAQRARNGFIVAQIALAYTLLTGASLLGVSLKQAMAVSPGFRADHVLTGQVFLPQGNYGNSSARLAFANRLLEMAAQEPGLSAVGVITNLPLQGMHNTDNVTVLGYTPKPGTPPNINDISGVTGDYFSAMGIPLQAGRFLDVADSERKEKVCVVDENFARHYWPTGNALGQKFFEGSPGKKDASEAFTIVGVVGAVKLTALTEKRANDAIYFPFRDVPDNVSLVARTSLPPEIVAAAFRRMVREIDPELPIDDIKTMDSRIGDSLSAQSSPALLSGVFAGVALFLASIGTYGVLSYAVAQRRREIGVRMALGARPAQIYSQFLSIGFRLLTIGTVVGAIGAWLARRAMESMLFNVPEFPVAALVGTTLVMAAVSLAACLIPSSRAARISPLEALADN